jgi:hypothetical protein
MNGASWKVQKVTLLQYDVHARIANFFLETKVFYENPKE